jgi:hypothetical protein
MKDPFVEEIRRTRRKLDRMDPRQFEADLESIRIRYQHLMVNFPPKRVPRIPMSTTRRARKPEK